MVSRAWWSGSDEKPFNMEKIMFETGKTYSCRSIGDYDCIFTYEVVRRTKKTVWIKGQAGEIISRRIQQYNGAEMIFPEGRYSMCPTLTSN